MHLARMALRFAILETLQPGGPDGTGPWPTVAKDRIYDSEFGPLTDRAADGRSPAIAVYTDQDNAENGRNALDDHGGVHAVTVAIEIMVPQLREAEGGDVVLTIADVDSGMEALLDVTCHQILKAIRRSWEAGPLSAVLAEVGEVKSEPWRDPDTSTRMAGRRIEMQMRVLNQADDGTGSGLALLPTPLRQVAERLPVDSPRYLTLMTIADAVAPAAPHPAADIAVLAGVMTRHDGDPAPPDPDATVTPPLGDVTGSIPL